MLSMFCKRKLRSEYIKSIKALEFNKIDTREFYITNRFNGKYYKTRCVDDLTYDLVQSERKFNEEILKKIRKHPYDMMDDSITDKLEERIKEITDKLPQETEIIMPYWEKFWDALDKCYSYISERRK